MAKQTKVSRSKDSASSPTGRRTSTGSRKPKFRKGERALCVGGCGVVIVRQVDYLRGQRRFQYHVSDEGGAAETVAHAARYLRKLPNRKMKGDWV